MRVVSEVYSWSKLSTFSRCPQKAYRRYVLREAAETPDFLVIGRAVHKGQEYDNREKLEHGRPARRDEVLECAVEMYRAEGGQDLDLFARDHERHLEAWHGSPDHLALVPVPGSIEAPFRAELKVEGRAADLIGYVDVIAEQGPTVVDYKTCGRTPSPNSLQLGIYQLVMEAAAGRLVAFVKHIRQRATVRATEPQRTTESLRERVLLWLADTIRGWRRAEQSGDWPKCAQECHWCSPAACEYYRSCYPEEPGRAQKLISLGKVYRGDAT